MKDFDLKPANDLGMTHTERALNLRRESGLIHTASHLAWLTAMHGYLKIYHRLQVVGRENLPDKPPLVLVGNHSSHLDALMLTATMPWRWCDRVFPIAAGDVFFETPIRARFAFGLLNALPMWRHNCGRHALRELRERLVDEPCAYILFPEGARSSDGEMLDFKAGIGMMLAKAPVPVVPCYLEGADRALPKGVKVPKPLKLRVHIGKPRSFESYPNKRDSWQQIADELQADVRELGQACHAKK